MKTKPVVMRFVDWRTIWALAAALGWRDGIDGCEYEHETKRALSDGRIKRLADGQLILTQSTVEWAVRELE